MTEFTEWDGSMEVLNTNKHNLFKFFVLNNGNKIWKRITKNENEKE